MEPRAVAVLRVALTSLEHDDPAAHRLMSSLIADLDSDGLCRVVETLTISVIELLDRLRVEDPGFEPDQWIQRLGLVAAGAS